MDMREAREMISTNGNNASGTLFDDSYTAMLKHKWSNYEVVGSDKSVKKVDFLQGLQEGQKAVVSRLYENQKNYLGGQLMEDTLSTGVGTFTKWALPMVRRLYTSQILPRIATVQPVRAKHGVMLTMGYIYDDAKGSKLPLGGISNNPYQQNYDGMLAAGDEAIKNFAVNYSNELVDYHVTCTDTGTAQSTQNSTLVNCTAISREWGPIRAPGTLGQRTFSVVAYYYTAEAGGTARIATLASTGTNLVDQDANVVGTCDVTTGAWTINALTIAGAGSTFLNNTVIYWQYWVDSEQAYTVSGGAIPSMSLSITEHAIAAEQFPLYSRWTLGGEMSWKGNFEMDFEPQAVSMLANEQAVNIDRYGINQMIAGAAHAATYAYATTLPGNMEKIQQLQLMIDQLGASIQTSSHRGPANFVVMHPRWWGMLKQLGANSDWARSVGERVPASHDAINADYGIQYAGVLPGTTMDVYLNPFQTQTQILVGYRGSNWLDAGFGYAPWVPLTITDTLTDPATLTKSKAVVSWGSMKMLRPEYFGVLTVSGLPTVTSIIP